MLKELRAGRATLLEIMKLPLQEEEPEEQPKENPKP